MQAIEFQTVINDDLTIAIPEKLRARIGRRRVRVIVMEDESFVSDRYETNNRDRDQDQNYISFRFANSFESDKSIPLLTRDEIYEWKG